MISFILEVKGRLEFRFFSFKYSSFVLIIILEIRNSWLERESDFFEVRCGIYVKV